MNLVKILQLKMFVLSVKNTKETSSRQKKYCKDLKDRIVLDSFTGTLRDHGVKISMDGEKCCMGNIFIERLWSSMKYEKIFLEELGTVPELLSGLLHCHHFPFRSYFINHYSSKSAYICPYVN